VGKLVCTSSLVLLSIYSPFLPLGPSYLVSTPNPPGGQRTAHDARGVVLGAAGAQQHVHVARAWRLPQRRLDHTHARAQRPCMAVGDSNGSHRTTRTPI
jgi:hypothetical protein